MIYYPIIIRSGPIFPKNQAADLSALLLVLLVCVTYASIAPLIILAGDARFATLMVAIGGDLGEDQHV
jgi:hypothetical protein